MSLLVLKILTGNDGEAWRAKQKDIAKLADPKLETNRLTHAPGPPEACFRTRIQAAESQHQVKGSQFSGEPARQQGVSILQGSNAAAKLPKAHSCILNVLHVPLGNHFHFLQPHILLFMVLYIIARN